MSTAKLESVEEQQKADAAGQNNSSTNLMKDPESSDEPQPMINEKALLAYDLQVDDQAYGVIERDANEIM